MKHLHKVTIKDDRVTLVVIERNYWGAISHRQQMTFPRAELEAALRSADITVPWQEVAR